MNFNEKIKIEFGIALTINKGSFRNCTHQNSELHSPKKWLKPFSISR